jgi:hypothetical protein
VVASLQEPPQQPAKLPSRLYPQERSAAFFHIGQQPLAATDLSNDDNAMNRRGIIAEVGDRIAMEVIEHI